MSGSPSRLMSPGAIANGAAPTGKVALAATVQDG